MKVYRDEFFPVDMILLSSSDPKGICYVETKNLDGETNLKHKQAKEEVYSRVFDDRSAAALKGKIFCQAPNEFLYKFEGTMNIPDEPDNIDLNADQQLLRGASLRNTDYIYGIAVYTGHNSKIMKNSPSARSKRSKVEVQTNSFIIYIFLAQVIFCAVAATMSTVWDKSNREKTDFYLGWSLDK